MNEHPSPQEPTRKQARDARRLAHQAQKQHTSADKKGKKGKGNSKP